MKDRENNQPNGVSLPPAWCGSICRNAMNEVCVEHCAPKRDCSGFDPKTNLKLADMPRFPRTEAMSREERFTVVTVYLSKIVDHLTGTEDETITPVIRRPLAPIVAKPNVVAEVTANIQGVVANETEEK
jgi:hypothetical protein